MAVLSLEEWKQHIDAQMESNIPIEKYCKQNGLTTSVFYVKRKLIYPNEKLKRKHVVAPSITETKPEFMPVKITNSNTEKTDLNITFRVNGIEISCNRNDIKIILGGIL